ncbi:hypothetical protein J6590_062124 [Homalodisca vitripennis]|nr:hypothetical protein J6590_062124 [Homalodisca vitripennis]
MIKCNTKAFHLTSLPPSGPNKQDHLTEPPETLKDDKGCVIYALVIYLSKVRSLKHEVRGNMPSLTQTGTNGLKGTFEPPPKAGQAGCLKNRIAQRSSKQQPRSTLLDLLGLI